jgi:hypothetical protein
VRPVSEAETRSRYERKRGRSLLPEYGLGSRGHSFASSSLWGKVGGLHACGATFSYIVPLPKSSVKSIALRSKSEKEGLPRGGTPALGAGGPEFKSRRPDQMYPAYFLQLIESTVHPKLRCGILADRRSEFASPLILEICFRLNIQEYRPKHTARGGANSVHCDRRVEARNADGHRVTRAW